MNSKLGTGSLYISFSSHFL